MADDAKTQPLLPDGGVAVFPLAPMDRLIFTMTLIFFPLPVVVWAIGQASGAHTLPVAIFIAALWAVIWIWFRPRRFELSRQGLSIFWPGRRTFVPISSLAGAEVLRRDELKARVGTGVRVGAGGLWGGFGLMVSSTGTYRLYVSRVERIVLVTARRGRSLLLTPDDPERFVAVLNGLVSRAEGDDAGTGPESAVAPGAMLGYGG